MFKIECFVDDKNLPALLYALAGIKAMNVKTTPVTNAAFVNGEMQAKISGGPVEQFAAWLKEKNLTRVGPNHLREFQQHIGRSPGGYNLLRLNAIKAGVLKRTKGTAKNFYDVIAK